MTVTADTSGTAGNAIVASFTAASGGGGGLDWTTSGGTLSGGSGAALDLNSATDAQAALTAVTAAINMVASQRGVIGAAVNRLTVATTVMNAQVQNLSSAYSGINDADIGQTVANMTEYNDPAADRYRRPAAGKPGVAIDSEAFAINVSGNGG